MNGKMDCHSYVALSWTILFRAVWTSLPGNEFGYSLNKSSLVVCRIAKLLLLTGSANKCVLSCGTPCCYGYDWSKKIDKNNLLLNYCWTTKLTWLITSSLQVKQFVKQVIADRTTSIFN